MMTSAAHSMQLRQACSSARERGSPRSEPVSKDVEREWHTLIGVRWELPVPDDCYRPYTRSSLPSANTTRSSRTTFWPFENW